MLLEHPCAGLNSVPTTCKRLPKPQKVTPFVNGGAADTISEDEVKWSRVAYVTYVLMRKGTRGHIDREKSM